MPEEKVSKLLCEILMETSAVLIDESKKEDDEFDRINKYLRAIELLSASSYFGLKGFQDTLPYSHTQEIDPKFISEDLVQPITTLVDHVEFSIKKQNCGEMIVQHGVTYLVQALIG